MVSLMTSEQLHAQTNPSDPAQHVIPNVFTPNGDGVNDTFFLQGFTGSWELMIFDRWGSLVFATQQAQGAAWNGANIQGEAADTGVYFYTLRDLNSDQSYKGSIHLFR
jgi:gliding motility-associated-like protein